MGKSKVYFLHMDQYDLIPEVIERVMGNFFKKNDFIALKVHFGEKGNKGFINPKWLKSTIDWVKSKDGVPFLTDTNTIYRGQRSDAVHHLQIAHGHGFKLEYLGAPVIIADGLRGNEFENVKIDGKHFKSVKIAKAISDAQAMIVLSHTKGHVLAGYGGAIKNLGMGCASKGAKYEMHASMHPKTIEAKCVACGECVKWCPPHAITIENKKAKIDEEKCIGCGECITACSFSAIDIPWDESSELVQERFAEHACGAINGKPVCYVNFMHYITRHCDCFGASKEGALLDNLGIMISDNPVAIDRASIDLINKTAGKDLFKELHNIDYGVQLNIAESLGMGTKEYMLISSNQ